jgi:cellulose biosynthesis protein BcsQ
MKVVACYSVKGGVGKSTLAANLAWASATLSARSTLLWDLDPQGSGGYLLGVDRPTGDESLAIFAHAETDRPPVVATAWPRLDVLPADRSLHELAGFLSRLGKKRRLAKLTQSLAGRYERIVLDCPPVLNELSSQVLRAADAIVVPLTASPLAERGLADVLDHLRRHHSDHAPVLPVFAMYDARRKLHQAAHAEHADWPVVPMASLVEQTAVLRRPIGDLAPRSPAAEAVARLWRGIESKLCGEGA